MLLGIGTVKYINVKVASIKLKTEAPQCKTTRWGIYNAAA
jgi:hypothetical protein